MADPGGRHDGETEPGSAETEPGLGPPPEVNADDRSGVDAAIARHRRKFWRRAAKVGLVLLLLIAGLVVAGFVAVSAYLTDERLRTIVVREMNAALAGSFSIDGIHLTVATATVVIDGFEVRDPDGEVVLTIDRAQARIAPWRLLHDEVRLLGVAAEGVDARLFPPPEGSSMDPAVVSFTLVAAFDFVGPPGDPDAPAWSVHMADFSIRDLDVVLTTGDDLSVTVAGGALDRGRLTFVDDVLDLAFDGALDRTEVHAAGYDFDLSAVRASGVVFSMGPGADGHLDLGDVVAAYADPALGAPGNLRGRGRIDGLGFDMDPMALGLDVTVEGTLDLSASALQAFLPDDVAAPLDVAGRTDVTVVVAGTPETPRVEGRFEADALRLSGESVTEASGRFSWEADLFRLEEIVLALSDARLEGSVGFDLSGEVLGWTLNAILRDVPVRRLAPPWLEAFEVEPDLPLPGRVSGELEVAGTGFDPPVGRLTGDVTLTGMPEGLPPGVPDPLRVRATARFDAERVHLEPARLTGGGADVTVQGRLALDAAGPIDVAVRALHIRPGELMRAYEVAGTAGQVDLTARVTGSAVRPRAQGTLRMQGLRLPDLPATDVAAPFRYADGVVHLDDARVAVAGGEIAATGAVTALTPDLDLLDDPRLNLQVRVSRVRLDAFAGEDIAGRVTANGRVEGTVSAPRGAGTASVEGLVIEGIPLSRAEARFAADGTWVSVEQLHVTPEMGGRLEGEGRLRLSDLHVEATFRAREVTVELANRFLDEPLPVSGYLEADGSAEGAWDDPAFDVTLFGRDLHYDGVVVGSIDAQVTGRMAHTDVKVGLEHEAGRVEAAGWVSLETEHLDLRVIGHRLRIERLPYVADVHPLEGRLTLNLTVQDRLRAPEVTGSIVARTLAYEGEVYGDGRVAVDVRPTGPGVHELVVDVLGATRLTAEARLEPSPSITATGRLEDLSAAWLAPPLAEHEIDATLTGRLDLGWRHDPADLSVDLHLERLVVDMAGQRLEANRPVRLAYDGEVASLDGLHLVGPHGTLEAWGFVGEVVDLAARGTLEMELLGPFIESVVRATGTMQIDLSVQGPRDAPVIEGDLSIARAIRLRPRRMIREVEIGSGRARFEPGKVTLERLSGQVHGGIFRASGEVHLDGLEPEGYDLTFSGQNLPLRTQELLLEANADLRVTGHGMAAKVGGRVDVVRGRYLQKFELDRFVFRPARRVVVDEPLAQRMPFLNDIDLDVRVTSLGAMEIRADAGAFALDMVLDADLKVLGTAAEPVLDGRVEANRGGLKFPRARLDVVRSLIEFVPRPGEAIRPRIDLRAEGEVSPPAVGEMGQTTYFVTLSLDGDLEEMILDLSSDPGLDRLEILSLLVTGRLRPTDGLGAGNGRQAEAAMVFAGAQLAEPLTRLVTQQLESLLNLELELSAEITTAGLSLAAGKEVTRRLRLEWAFQRAFGDAQGSSTARARYLLSDRVFLEGTTEAFMGQAAGGATSRDASRTRLELKLRLYGE